MRRFHLTTLSALALLSGVAYAAEAETGSAEAPAAAPAEAPAKAERVKLVEQNGVSQPQEGTKTRRVWDIANELSNSLGRPALRDEVMEKALAEGMNRGTIATQYGKWCTFYGVSTEARKAVRADNNESKAAQKKAAKAAEKAAAAPAADAATAEVPASAPLIDPAALAAQSSGVDDGEE